MTTITRKIKLNVAIPEKLGEKERKEYKDFAWGLIRNINQQNFELHKLAVDTLMGIDASITRILNADQTFIALRNEYFSNKGNDEAKKKYYNHITQTKIKYLAKQGQEIENKNGKPKSVKSIADKYVYNEIVKYLKSLPQELIFINSYTYCSISKNVCDKYWNDLFESNIGKKSQATYKNTQPIPINIKIPLTQKTEGKGKFWFEKNEKGDYQFILRNSKKHVLKLNLIFGRDKSNNRFIVDKIWDNDPKYKFCDSKIQYVNGELYLLLVVSLPNKGKSLDTEKVLGVDLGMKWAAYIANNKNTYQRRGIGEGNFILLKEKDIIRKKVRTAQKNGAFNRGGHGRKRKLQRLNNFKNKENNFRNNFNHNISRKIIDMALEWGCGQINVEDLSLSGNNNHRLLRNWTYYDLLSKIEYKAKKHGIVFKKVNPAYTSQTCNVCGEKGFRETKDDRNFICTNENCIEFNLPVDGDLNAAINISKM